MLIRKIVTDDNAAMADIIRNSLLQFNAAKPGTVYYDTTTDNLSDLFTQKRSAYFVIEINNEIAGGCGIFPTKGLRENTCELVKLYVSKKYRHNGYGQMLLEKCIEEAKKYGYEKMYLESMPELKNAIGLYQKNGFENIAGPLGNSGHSGCDVWMVKEL
ncbi:MAG TPA: GNAT family N-acetyltransferase [Hanamia sp.]|nr:GNAT family N-acetyltransferase [Hanamia sp.]